MRKLGGKMLLTYAFDAMTFSNYLTRTAFSSNDADMLAIANQYKILPINRPDELARDHTPTLPALQHAVRKAELYFNMTFPFIVEVRATNPFIMPQDIDGVIDVLVNTDADSVITVAQLHDKHPARIKWLDEYGRLRDFLPEPESGRRQDCKPDAYIRNGTLYAFRRDALMGENGRLFGHKESYAYIMPEERSINIDTELDFLVAKTLLESELNDE